MNDEHTPFDHCSPSMGLEMYQQETKAETAAPYSKFTNVTAPNNAKKTQAKMMASKWEMLIMYTSLLLLSLVFLLILPAYMASIKSNSAGQM